MRVSIVIPAYNAAATIAETLASVCAQTHADWEAVVVDDGSRDETGAIAGRIAAHEPRIRVLTQANGGEAAARNAGIAATSSDWLLFLDADDWIAPAYLATMTSALTEDPSLDAVICRYARVAADGAELVEAYQPPPGDLFAVLARRAAFAVHACVVRARLVAEVGGFDPTLKTSPDWDLWQRIARTGARFGVVPEVLAFYRMSANGASLDAAQLFKDGVRVLRRGHAADPRVPRPHPDHANGLAEPVQAQEFYLLSWCAGLLIGSGRDPRPLFDIVGSDRFPDLYPAAAAQCVFDSVPLPNQRTTAAWPSLWAGLAPRLEDFFAALEAHSSAHGLAPQAMASIKRMLLTASPMWDLIREVLDAQEALLEKDRQTWAGASAGYESALQELRDLASRWEADAHARAAERDEAGRIAAAQQLRSEALQDGVRAIEHDRDRWRQAAADRQAEIDALRHVQQTLERERDDARARATAADAQLASLLERVTSLEADAAARGEEAAARGRDTASLRDQLTKRDESLLALHAEHSTLLETRAQLERDGEALRELVTATEQARHLLDGTRKQLEGDVRYRNEEIERLTGELASATADRDATRTALDQRTFERDTLQQSLERRFGDLLLNRWRLRRPVVRASGLQSSLAQRASYVRLGLEGRLPKRGRTRVLATACDVFPIYSQTFVYQEQTQLLKHGFDVRFVYSKLDNRDLLATPFSPLWDTKRQLHLNDETHRADYAAYRRRMPDKVNALVGRLAAASGLSAADIEHHGNFLQAFTFTRMVEAYRPDYLHSYFFYDRSLMTLVAAFLLDLPRGVSCYADHVLQDYELKVVPLHMELCDIVIATSERIKRELTAIAPTMNPDKILVKPNGVDTSRFAVPERYEPSDGHPFRLVTVCRIEPKKGLLDLVDAVALLRQRGVNVEAHIVGTVDEWSQASRDYKSALDARITERELWGKVHLEGRHGFEGISRFLGIAHLFVAPFVETATGDKDGIPTALLEGMATGLPAVGTDAGSITEVIDASCGLVTAQHDPEALANAIQSLLTAADRRIAMGTAAAARVRERFDAETLERSFHERVHQVTSRERAGV